MAKRITDEIAYSVYTSTNYDKFIFVDDNRKISRARVQKILASIEKIGFRRVPILVNSRYEIMDGQGRFTALKEKGLPIQYVIDKDADIEVCRQLNIGQTNWKPIDYVGSYAADGNNNYINLVKLMAMFPDLSLNVITGVCSESIITSGWQIESVNDGDFKLSKNRMKELLPILDFLNECSTEIKKMKGSKRTLYTMFAWIISQDGVDEKKIRKIIKDKYPIILPCVDIVTSLTQISDLYNKGIRTKSERIHFEIIYKDND